METIDVIKNRNSSPRLAGSITESQIEDLLRAGLRAPDHAQLRPWRIVVIQGKSREKLGALFAQAKLTRDPNVTRAQLEKLKSKPLRAPVIFVVAACPVEHAKVPEIEQMLSAGSVAQNILIAAHSLGLGAMWRTGQMAYDGLVNRGLGLSETDKIVGFIYLGELEGRQKNVPVMDLEKFVTHW